MFDEKIAVSPHHEFDEQSEFVEFFLGLFAKSAPIFGIRDYFLV